MRPSVLKKLKTRFQDLSAIRPEEFSAALLSFAFVLILMSSWYILRPVRDALISDWSDYDVSLLISIALGLCFVAVSVYGFAVTHLRFKIVVPALYGVFGLSFFGFYWTLRQGLNPELTEKTFFVWMSIFSLFHVSVFWGFMTEMFSKAQSQRLFAFIASGSSIGAILGPIIPLLFAERVGTNNLILLASSLLLFLTMPLIIRLEILKARGSFDDHEAPFMERNATIGGHPFQGFKDFLNTPYLIAIGCFILLYTMISTIVYFELKNLMVGYDEVTRQKIWAGIDLGVNVMSIVTAWFFTSHIVRRFGLAVSLALMPVVICFGFLVIAFSAQLVLVAALQLVRRAGNYAITRPAREMLFTAIDRPVRLKAKPVIDIVVYRGGDMLTAWGFTALTGVLGLSLAGIAVIGAGLAAIWGALGIYLGRHFVQQDHNNHPIESSIDSSSEIGAVKR